MPWRNILRMIVNHPQLIQKLSESPPIKHSAKAVAAIINKARFTAEDKVDELKEKAQDAMKQDSMKYEEKDSITPGSFSETFMKELKDGFKGLSDQLEREKELEKERQQMEEELKKENKK
ncbi:protein NCBP2AS2-like [Pecten maximus]|uniref:protein NCBP2AS2-like n=1 Tax=Pecten maximus TaxID=6579 RepID=UPI00145832B3|nr:protein NCBP2AS2-like [Pecten maximus]